MKYYLESESVSEGTLAEGRSINLDSPELKNQFHFTFVFLLCAVEIIEYNDEQNPRVHYSKALLANLAQYPRTKQPINRKIRRATCRSQTTL